MIPAEKFTFEVGEEAPELAQQLYDQGFATVRLHNTLISDDDEVSCTCRTPTSVGPCRSPGKHPRSSSWNDATAAPPDGNMGLRCGPQPNGTFVVTFDCDIPARARQALLSFGININNSLLQTTPGGGLHSVWTANEKIANQLRNRTGLKEAYGLDLRVANGQVVLAGSVAGKVSKEGELLYIGEYEVDPKGSTAINHLPDEALSKFIQASTQVAQCVDQGGELPEGMELSDAFKDEAEQYFKSFLPAIEGQGGHGRTLAAFSVAIRGFLLTPELADEVLQKHWNPRCVPPWDLSHTEDERQWYRKRDEAFEKGAVDWGSKTLSFDGSEVLPSWPGRTIGKLDPTFYMLLSGSGDEKLQRRVQLAFNDGVEGTTAEIQQAAAWLWSSSCSKAGAYHPRDVSAHCNRKVAEAYQKIWAQLSKIQNGRLSDYVRLLQYDANWAGVLRFDEASGAKLAVGPCPLPGHRGSKGAKKVTDFNEPTALNRVQTWVEGSGYLAYQSNVRQDLLRSAVHTVCLENTFSSLREYFVRCANAWDGERRIDLVIERCFNPNIGSMTLPEEERVDVMRKISRGWMIGAAGRGMVEKGEHYKFEHQLVLISTRGGVGKGRWFNAISPDPKWVAEAGDPRFDTKDVLRKFARCFLALNDELTLGSKQSKEDMKRLLSMQYFDDREEHTSNQIRRTMNFVLVGTTNNPSLPSLSDPAGDRRNIPVLISEEVDVAWAEENRDQLWGEAANAILVGEEKHWELLSIDNLQAWSSGAEVDREQPELVPAIEKLFMDSMSTEMLPRDIAQQLELVPEYDEILGNYRQNGSTLTRCQVVTLHLKQCFVAYGGLKPATSKRRKWEIRDSGLAALVPKFEEVKDKCAEICKDKTQGYHSDFLDVLRDCGIRTSKAAITFLVDQLRIKDIISSSNKTQWFK